MMRQKKWAAGRVGFAYLGATTGVFTGHTERALQKGAGSAARVWRAPFLNFEFKPSRSRGVCDSVTVCHPAASVANSRNDQSFGLYNNRFLV